MFCITSSFAQEKPSHFQDATKGFGIWIAYRRKRLKAFLGLNSGYTMAYIFFCGTFLEGLALTWTMKAIKPFIEATKEPFYLPWTVKEMGISRVKSIMC